MRLSEELRNKQSRDNRDLLDRAADRIDELEACLSKQNEGEWIDVEDTFLYRYKCSLCGEIKLGKMTSFCPNCGAKMKGGAE